MSTNPPPELKSLFEAALNEFEKRAGTNLVQHPILDKLVNCESADSVIDVLQEQAQAFRNFRGDDGKVIMWLKRTVNVVYTLSTSGVLGGAISLVCVHSSCRTLALRAKFFSSAFPSSECDICWTRYTSWRMCSTWAPSRILVTFVISIRQSKTSARATIPLLISSSLSNPSSGASTYIQRFHPPRQFPRSS